jgi:hypothetical protein
MRSRKVSLPRNAIRYTRLRRDLCARGGSTHLSKTGHLGSLLMPNDGLLIVSI